MGNLGLVFQGFHSSVFSTVLPSFDRPSFRIVAADHVWPVADRNPPVQMLMNRDRTSG